MTNQHSGAQSFEKIEKAVNRLRAKDTSLTEEQAISKAVEQNPTLREAYQEELAKDLGMSRAGRPAPSPTMRRINQLALMVAQEHPDWTQEQCVAEVIRRRPDLGQAHRDEQLGKMPSGNE